MLQCFYHTQYTSYTILYNQVGRYMIKNKNVSLNFAVNGQDSSTMFMYVSALVINFFISVPSRVSIFPWKCTIVFKYYIGGISIANTAWCLLMLHHWNTEIPKLFRWSRDVESNRVKKMMRGPHNISSAAISTAHFKDSTYLYLHNRTYESV